MLFELSKNDPQKVTKSSKWSDWVSVPGDIEYFYYHQNEMLVIYDGAFDIASKISCSLNLPHLELRIQEGDHWDLSLYKNNELVADFSVKKSYFNSNLSDKNPWKYGSYDEFIKIWGETNRDLSKYFVDWTSVNEDYKCYDTDRHNVNDYLQIYDLMDGFGISLPAEENGYSILKCKGWKGEYRRQPLFRRVIRKISVWYKGTYPDVPRQTPVEKEIWNERKGSIKIIKSKSL